MKLEKAREIIQLNIKEAGKKMPPDVKDALILACEALEDFERHRGRVESGHYRILPSETQD